MGYAGFKSKRWNNEGKWRHNLQYERLMNEQKFHVVMNLMDNYIREINKYYVKYSREFENDEENYKQIIVNTMQKIRTATVLMHPIVQVERRW